MSMHYSDKRDTLKDIFGTNTINLEKERMIIDGKIYPIVDDVIIILEPSQYPPALKKRLQAFSDISDVHPYDFAEDIQFTFGEEWQRFSQILPEHEKEFKQYFDLIDSSKLKNARICDLGCGIGRWSYFLKDKCSEIVLVDFSEAIFVARQNLKDVKNALFFMGDLMRLPFRDNFVVFLFCLGVLHHLPSNALTEVRALKKYASSLLIYLYYALDNRPFYFRSLLVIVTAVRRFVSKIRRPAFRSFFTWSIMVSIYLPFIWLGKLLMPTGFSKYVPLYESYNGKGMERIRQDVYDRFFTSIEQRFSKKQIMELRDTFSDVIISEKLPYWHFICER